MKKLSWLWDTAASKEEEPPKKKVDKFSLMDENIQKSHKNFELQKEISKLNKIIIDQQEQINELQKQVGISSISIFNPQTKKYYSRQEDIQKIVNSLNELYIEATNKMNSMLENLDF